MEPDFYETRSLSPHATRLQKIETSFSNKIRTRLSFTAQKHHVRESDVPEHHHFRLWQKRIRASGSPPQIVYEPRFVNCTCVPFSEKIARTC
jgi:hypothetical protein